MVLVSVLKISSNIGRDLVGEMPSGDHHGEVALASEVGLIFVELKSYYSVIVLNSSPLVMFWSLKSCSKHNTIMILLKQNTALLSTSRMYVAGVTSQLFWIVAT